MVIDINVTNFCNYSCKYCTGHIYNVKKQFIDFNNTINLLKRISKKHIIKKISICGNSEPTLHPNLYQFLTILNFNCIIELYSNLSANIDLYEQILKIKNIVLIASYHNINNNLNIQFIKKLTKLNKDFFDNICCDIIIEPNQVEKSLLAYKMIKSIVNSKKCFISLVDNYESLYSITDINILKHEQLFDFEKLKIQTVVDNTTKLLHINYNGKLYYASYKSFNTNIFK